MKTMKNFFTRIHIACLLFVSFTGMLQTQAQTSVFQSTSRRIIYAYEGFDYFGGVNDPISVGQNPSSINNPVDETTARATSISQPTTTGLSLHNINTAKSNTNSFHSLGWAGDWIASNGAGTPYRLSTTPVQNIITSPVAGGEKFSLVNCGFYATMTAAGGGTIGRRLQTSTGGDFYEYEIFNEANQNSGLDANYTNEYWYRGGINPRDRFARTLPASTIRTLGSTAQCVHKVTEATDPLPTLGQNPRSVGSNKYTGQTYTSNTCIGASGSTIWMGFLMRLSATAANNEDAFINLNRSTNPYTVDNAKVSIGYFGTTDAASFGTGATKRWGIRVGGTSYVSPLALGNPADSSTVKLGKFTLLVVSITFDYVGNNTVKFFAINDNSANYDDFTADGIIDEPATPTATFSIPGDLSFHSVAYNGGSSIGRSDIDEIRFARSFDLAALASQTIALVRDLCETDLDGDGQVDATAGFNVNANGDLGSSATAGDPNGLDANNNMLLDQGTSSTDEQLGTSSNYNTTYDPPEVDNTVEDRTNHVEDRVIFKKGSALLGVTRYDALAPGFTYNIDNNGQPNDGNYYVGTQSRTPFSNAPTGVPVWINAYDNSGTKLGNMMVINASYDRSLYFQQTVSGICPGTQYEFYADILNLFTRTVKTVTNNIASGAGASFNCGCYTDLEPGCGQFSFSGTDQANSDGLGGATQTADWQLPASVSGTLECFSLNPEIEFLIDGVPIYIPPISVNNDEKWHRVGFTFVTKNTNSLVVSVRNRAPGGNGNDLAMDNFIFRPCGPSLNMSGDGVCQTASPGTTKVIQYTPKGKTYRRPYYRWVIQKCTLNCTGPIGLRGFGPEIVLGGQAFYDPDLAEFNVDTVAGTPSYPTPGFAAEFPSGIIPQGSRIRVYSASESDANTQDANCRITGAPSYTSCDITTLPVNLLEFKATPERGSIRLDWKTIKEKDLKEFSIERSVNGHDFNTIGTVAPLNNGKEIKSYLYYDMNPIEGNSYYRLKIINADNSYQYSKIEDVHVRLNYRIHPVPADDKLIISLVDENTKNRNIQIRVRTLLGSLLMENAYILQSGQTDIEISVSSLRTGIYIVEIRDGNNLDKKRFVINR